jgi:hypothetical protein
VPVLKVFQDCNFCDFLLNKITVLPPGDRNWQLIPPH